LFCKHGTNYAYKTRGLLMGLNLITRQEYKTYAAISSTNYDQEIDSLIKKTSALVKNYCRRTFVDYYSDPLQEISNGGYREIILKETPLVQVLGVEQSQDFGRTYQPYEHWVQSGDLLVATNHQGVFPPLVNGYRINYFAGFETVPEDLKLALLDLVNYYRKNDAAVHSNKAPSLQGTNVEYIKNASFPAHIRRVLDLYVADYL
jgi:hypothetical protein